MPFCLTKPEVVKFKQALKSGDIDPEKLSKMTSEERRSYISKFVGESNAIQVNGLFESKLLLKNQQAGMISWAKKVSGLTPQAKKDLFSKIENLGAVLDPKEEEQFLQDLASTKLGINVTQEEAKTISDYSKKISDLKTKANTEGVFANQTDRFNYGMAKVNLEDYVNQLKLEAQKISFREHPLKKIMSAVGEVPGVMKSAVTTWDNSFWGRQGVKTLLDMRTAPIWTKNFLKSWVDIGRELVGKDAMSLIKADIYSRPNALNGKYEIGNYGLHVMSEEAYPSSWPEKIPLLGRLFKASESAYNGGALRLRADLADRLIKIAEKQGIDTLDKTQAEGMGQLISSLTGRGSLGKDEGLGKQANVLLFSAKFLKGNFDVLTAHQFDAKATLFTKKEAAKNLLSIIATIASVTTIASALDPNSVDPDPRSTNAGKVKIFGHWVDITGGMGSLVTLASRLVPTQHNGQWGLWSKSSNGNWTNLTEGKYGQQTALDVFENFWEGKLSPVAGLLRDVWQGKNFQGQPVTLENALPNLLTPLSIQNFGQLKEDPNSSNILGSMILDMLGLSTSTYTYKADWSTSTGVEMKQFKEKIGEDKFKIANDDYNKAYSQWYSSVSNLDTFKKLTEDGKTTLITNAKSALKDKIFKEYGFKYVAPKKTEEQKQEKSVIDSLKNKINMGLVKNAYAAEMANAPADRQQEIALDYRKKHPDWYTANVGEAGEIKLYGKTLGEWPIGLKQVAPPKDIKTQVMDVGQKYKVDPALISAMLFQESGYRPNAKNDGGVNGIDRGIAQINSKAHPEVTDAQAYDRRFAVNWIAKEMASAIKYFGGDVSKAVASYNVGRGGVTQNSDKGFPFGGGAKGQAYINNVSKNLTDEAIKRLGIKI